MKANLCQASFIKFFKFVPNAPNFANNFRNGLAL